MATFNPFFYSTSSEKPKLLRISFENEEPSASLGAQMVNLDKDLPEDSYSPGYASIGKIIPGETIAQKAGVKTGDVIVAVNGLGFRRFAVEYKHEELQDISSREDADIELSTSNEFSEIDFNTNQAGDETSMYRVMGHLKTGYVYPALLSKIKEVKAAADPMSPLTLVLERYDWDSRVLSFPRFLDRCKGDVRDAMLMLQKHEDWKESTFPIDLTSPVVQEILKKQVLSECLIQEEGYFPTLYINCVKLQTIEDCTSEDLLKVFTAFFESIIQNPVNPQCPKICHLIDLSSVSISAGLRSELLKEVYEVYEKQYPGTIYKVIIYPVPQIVADFAAELKSMRPTVRRDILQSSTAKSLLNSFTNDTRARTIITDELQMVCKHTGLSVKETARYGSIMNLLERHSKIGKSMIFE